MSHAGQSIRVLVVRNYAVKVDMRFCLANMAMLFYIRSSNLCHSITIFKKCRYHIHAILNLFHTVLSIF